MSLRARLTLIMCVTVAVAVVLVSLLGYAVVRRQLLDDVDRQLGERAEFAATSSAVVQAQRVNELGKREVPSPTRRPERGFPPLDPFADPDTAFQLVDASGDVVARPGGNPLGLPVADVDTTTAAASAGTATYRTVTVDDRAERMLTLATGNDIAVQVSRSLESTNETLDTLVILFAALGGVVIAVAVATGFVITRRSLQPIGRLTVAAEEIARTKDPGTRDPATDLDVVGSDEVGRLAAAFNEMLRALSSAREQQRQLVADASHELRTPLTSLRTNIEVLSRAAERGQLDDLGTRALMDDVRHELEALSTLVAEIVDLATDAITADAGEVVDVDLAALVTDVAERAARRHGVVVDVHATRAAGVVRAVPGLLERAVSNLLENAAKWNVSGRPIEVDVDAGTVLVRDHGPGLRGADPARVFDRFYRGPDTQAVAGSGLGLAIVKQVVDRHGGRVVAGDTPGGGATMGFEIPVPPRAR